MESDDDQDSLPYRPNWPLNGSTVLPGICSSFVSFGFFHWKLRSFIRSCRDDPNKNESQAHEQLTHRPPTLSRKTTKNDEPLFFQMKVAHFIPPPSFGLIDNCSSQKNKLYSVKPAASKHFLNTFHLSLNYLDFSFKL